MVELEDAARARLGVEPAAEAVFETGAVVQKGERAEVRGDLVCIWARPRADGAACPRCRA